ncbi:hypothetical protein ACFLR4_02905 [Bacteroidota bacterium]
MRNLTKISALFVIILLVGTNLIIAQKTKEFEETYQMNKSGKVSIDTYKGSILVETWDKAEVEVYALMEADDNWDCTDPDEQLRDVEIDVSNSSSYVRIKSDYDNRNSRGCNTLAFVHYKIKMPKTAELDINDYKSETEIKNVKGYIDIVSYKGRIDISGFDGGLDLETYKGNAKVVFVNFSDDSSFDTYKGDIDIYLPDDTKFSLDVDLEKKADFECDWDIDARSSSLRKRDLDFKGDVNGGGSYIELSSYKGNIRILRK